MSKKVKKNLLAIPMALVITATSFPNSVVMAMPATTSDTSVSLPVKDGTTDSALLQIENALLDSSLDASNGKKKTVEIVKGETATKMTITDKKTGVGIDAEMVQFESVDGKELIPYFENGTFHFDDKYAGEKIIYRISEPGMKVVNGEVELLAGTTNLHFEGVKKERVVLISDNVELTRGDEGDLKDFLNVPQDAAGKIKLDILEGESVSMDGTVYHAVKDGMIKLRATLEEDDAYAESSVEFYIVVKEPEMQVKDGEVIYGEDIPLSEFVTPADGFTGKITYSVVDGNAAYIDNDMLHMLSTGSVRIKAENEAVDGYEAVSKEFSINISKKDIGTITPDMIDWKTITKPYDGDATMHLEGTLKQSAGIVNGDDVVITGVVDLGNPKAGLHKTTFANIEIKGADNYSYVLPKNGPGVTVTAAQNALAADNVVMTYGDQIDITKIVKTSSWYDGILSYTVEGNSIEVTNTGKIITKGTGESVVKVVASSTSNYEEATTEFTVNVEKKDLGTISAADIVWDKTEKVYDGEATYKVSGSIRSKAGIEKKDAITFSADAIMTSADGGKHDSRITNISIQGADNYILTIPDAGPEITVKEAETVLKADDIAMEYGDTEELEKYVQASNGYDGKLTFAIMKGQNAKISNGSIEATGTGDVTVRATAPATRNFKKSYVDFKVRISPKKIGTIRAEDVEWKTVKKTYDATDHFHLKGTVKKSLGLVGSDEITIEAEAKLASKDAGKEATTLSEIKMSGVEKYEIKMESVGPDVDVEPLSIDATINDLSVEYGSKEWRTLSGGNLPDKWTVDNLIHLECDSLTTDEVKEIKNIRLSDYYKLKLLDKDFYVGSYPNAIRVISTGVHHKNYKFNISQNRVIGVEVTRKYTPDDKDVWDSISFNPDESTDAWMSSEGHIFVRPGGKAAFGVNDSQDLYDSVNIKQDTSSKTDSYANYFAPAVNAKDGLMTGSVYLSVADHGNTRTGKNNNGKIEDNHMPEIVSVDGSYPSVKFAVDAKNNRGINKETRTTEKNDGVNVNELIFEQIKSGDDAVISYEISDDVNDGIAGSGLKDARYKVIRLEDRDQDHVFTQSEAVELINEESISTNGWTKITKENGNIRIPGNDDGYYVVLMSVCDNVGNSAIYATNGVVIDTSSPVVNVTGLVTLENGDTKRYADDVNYKIEVSSASSITSGLKEIKVDVISDNKIVNGTKRLKNGAIVGTDSFVVDDDDIAAATAAGKTNNLDGLNKRSSLVIKAAIRADEIHSNDTHVRITVKDMAGNVTTWEPAARTDGTNNIVIDSRKPTIKATYDNNHVENGKYFNQTRTMTLTYQEREFSEEDAMFTVRTNKMKAGENTRYSLADLRKGLVKGITVKAGSNDTEKDADRNRYTDNRKVSVKLVFGEDAATDMDFHIEPSLTDKAGNTTSKVDYDGCAAPTDFVIDKVAPVLDMNYMTRSNTSVVPGHVEDRSAYANEAIIGVLNVTERNFDSDQVKITQTSKDHYGKNIEAERKNSKWADNSAKHAITMTFDDEANYSLAVEYRDLAGNKAVMDPMYFTVDKTAPSGSITINTKDLNETHRDFSNSLKFKHYTNKGLSVGYNADDSISGLKSVKYHIHHPGSNSRGVFSGLSLKAMDDVDWKDWNGSLKIDTDGDAVVYMRVEDKAGNVKYMNASDAIIVDSVAPEIEVSIDENDKIHNNNVPFEIRVNDPEKAGTYAGLRSVSYEVLNNGEVTQSGNYDNELSDRSGRVKSSVHNETVKAELNNSNHVQIRVKAVDYAGNVTNVIKDVKVDITRPAIAVTYDQNNDTKFYKTPRTATVTILERNFDPDKVKFDITSSTGKMPVISNWSIGNDAGEKDEAVNTCTITFDSDADYTFNVSCVDEAGNRSDYNQTDEFTVDQTAPTVRVDFDNNDAKNRNYYKSSRTAKIIVTEHNFDAAHFTADVKKTLSGREADAPRLTGWKSDGDVHVATITFDKDGDYSFTFKGKDLAGNETTTYTCEGFTVDLTAPNVSFANVENEKAYSGIVCPVVVGEDANSTEESFKLTLRGSKHKDHVVNGKMSKEDGQWKFALDDFGHTIDEDDIYTLNATFTDLAGNTTTKSVTFSVNRFGSNYSFDNITTQQFQTKYVKNSCDITIYETNVNALSNQKIIATWNGEICNLKKGVDYKVVEKKDESSWHCYEYVIDKSCFEKEGNYEIKLSSEDAAGNKQDNKIKQADIRFVVDKTAPSVVLTGIDDNGRYRDVERVVTVNVADNTTVKKADVFVDGQKVKSLDAETIAKNDGKFDYKLMASDNWQKVEVRVLDVAGNKACSANKKVFISSSAWQQYLHNTPVFVGSVMGMIAIAATFPGFMYKRKKKHSEEKN